MSSGKLTYTWILVLIISLTTIGCATKQTQSKPDALISFFKHTDMTTERDPDYYKEDYEMAMDFELKADNVPDEFRTIEKKGAVKSWELVRGRKMKLMAGFNEIHLSSVGK